MSREDIIKLCERQGIVVAGEAVFELCELVAAAEREACAKLCADDGMLWGARYAAKIRARGKE